MNILEFTDSISTAFTFKYFNKTWLATIEGCRLVTLNHVSEVEGRGSTSAEALCDLILKIQGKQLLINLNRIVGVPEDLDGLPDETVLDGVIK